jgi:adenosine deaminase
VTRPSPDPPSYAATIGGESEIPRPRLGFDEDRLKAITQTAIDAAFCDDALKSSLRARAGRL